MVDQSVDVMVASKVELMASLSVDLKDHQLVDVMAGC
jgi:hypothetical protein